MARDNNNFLLGYGERLTENVKIKSSSGSKEPPYDFETARRQISQWLHQANDQFNKLSIEACPKDKVTVVFTAHPRYISKSDFPSELFNKVGLEVVGGRSRKIRPKAWGVTKHPEEAMTDEFFIMSSRKNLKDWVSSMKGWDIKQKASLQLSQIEELKAYTAIDKVQAIRNNQEEVLLEVVLHGFSKDIIDSFESYVLMHDGKPNMDYLRRVQELAFIPVRTTKERINKLADFSFIRVIREMPRLRQVDSSPVRSTNYIRVALPKEEAIDSTIKVAVFDGGIPKGSLLKKWVNPIEANGIGPSYPVWVRHGVNVTSALLFGPIDTDQGATRPICEVDHIRVLDSKTGKNGDFECYDVLDRITKSLSQDNTYEFINISLGPDITIDDGEVNRWTASLDQLFAGSNKIVTVAVGNHGDLDPVSGLNRIQPPSDGVNVLSVGACNCRDETSWKRAEYSCVGPGRCPGVVKPDGVIFGGSDKDPFMVFEPKNSNLVTGESGTSLAAPYLLRTAIGVRAYIGNDFGPLALRTLLVHRADRGNESMYNVGWGKFENDLNTLVTCDDDEALVVFQGELPLSEHLRAPIPLPDGTLQGKVSITATLVISPEVDPAYPNTYTRSGLEVIFRPNSTKFTTNKNGKKASQAKTKSFFSQKIIGLSEYDLREDGHKWEPCLKATGIFSAKTLNKPCFDIYYHHRFEGKKDSDPQPIKYALVISIKAPKNKNFYNDVVRTYSNILIPLRSKVGIRISN